MRIIKLQEHQPQEVIDAIIACLNDDGLVIYPTETVYGIGANPHSKKAIDKLLTYKGRREGKPLSIAVANQTIAANYVDINEQARKFYQKFLPGPYTVVSKSKHTVDPRVNSEFGTLGIRIPAYPLMLELLQQYGQGITSTSANISGGKRPYRVQDLLDQMGEKQQQLVDLIIDAGELPKNEPSVVVDTTLSTPIALRGQLHGEYAQNSDGSETLHTQSETETMELAGRIMLNQLNQLHAHGLVLALDGDLGMGKTIFAKGVAQFLGISEPITSPTYSYSNEYTYTRQQTTGMLYHLDVWKIDQAAEVAFLEIEKLIQPNNVLVIEWWSQIAHLVKLPTATQLITLKFTGEGNKRTITITKKYAQDS
jgi:L-threonylcarbamoyladenylate synthase